MTLTLCLSFSSLLIYCRRYSTSSIGQYTSWPGFLILSYSAHTPLYYCSDFESVFFMEPIFLISSTTTVTNIFGFYI